MKLNIFVRIATFSALAILASCGVVVAVAALH